MTCEAVQAAMNVGPPDSFPRKERMEIGRHLIACADCEAYIKAQHTPGRSRAVTARESEEMSDLALSDYTEEVAEKSRLC